MRSLQTIKTMDIKELLAQEFKLSTAQVTSTVKLIDEGNTIPFIARYRKEATGGIDDITLRNLDERLTYLRNLEARKEEVIRLIDEQGKLTDELREEIVAATVMQRVEDLYKPFKKKRATRASKARDAGLSPLAEIITAQGKIKEAAPLELAEKYINAEAGYDTAEKTLYGALDIIAENVAEDAEIIAELRAYTKQNGRIVSVAANEQVKDEKTVYELYYDFSEPLVKIPNHRVLAINRGEKEEKLKVKVEVEAGFCVGILESKIIKKAGVFTSFLKDTLADSYKRLISPSLEREMRTELTERAETDAIKVFAKNTEKLLLIPPVKGAKVLAIDPGYRTGCKVAVLDEYGKLLDYCTIFPTQPRCDVKGSTQKIEQLCEKYNINVIVVGNGTGSRETEEVVSDFIKGSDKLINYTIVNEAGASVYSASKIASEEYPDLDVTTRGAMSLGRRLQDPLAELVKIPPKSIGVGQYQHDINQSALEKSLGDVVENVVNRVGVDLNTASASLLSYVAGIGTALAKNIVAYREENGAFIERKQLKKVPKLGEKAFKQCAGFLRVSDGKNPLDATGIHPESYTVASKILEKAGLKPSDLASKKRTAEEKTPVDNITNKIGNLAELAEETGSGIPTLNDIIAELNKPGRDIREDAPSVVFSRTIKSLEDLTVGLELTGTVRNVVDFGVFVDIGVKNDGLVHVSKMSNKFIRHPSEVSAVGDSVKVWISSIDKERGKVGLSMVKDKI